MSFSDFFHSGGGRSTMVRLYDESDQQYVRRVAEMFYCIGKAEGAHEAMMAGSRGDMRAIRDTAHDRYAEVDRLANTDANMRVHQDEMADKVMAAESSMEDR